MVGCVLFFFSSVVGSLADVMNSKILNIIWL